ncbi:MAG: hypothetical protein E6Q97_30495 [Desulfurellales bacterium]|nr:MAG: hypothetical protein E6Q97_30495 [Desulfurellales bacterium]
MAGPYDNLSDEELEAEIRRLERGQQVGPTFTPIPQTPSQQRKETREEEANRRAEEANRRANEAERRAAEAEARAAQKFQDDRATIQARGGVDTTESERTASFLATRVAGGIGMLGRVGVGGAPSYWQRIAGDSELGNYVTDEERQRVVATQIDILDAALTLGTGAAYTREQIEGYRKSYFPQPGDKPGTIADKKERLKLLLEASRIKAGGAAHFIDEAILRSGVFNPRPTDDRQDAPSALGFANAGDDRKSIPIPEQMQAEFQAGLRNVRTADDFATLRDRIDRKYGFAPNTPEQMQANRDYWSQTQGRPGQNIPPADAAMQVQDRLNNSLFNNPVGAGIMAAPIAAPFMDEIAGGMRSVFNGTNYQVERDIADATKQNLQSQFPLSSITGALASSVIGGGMLAKAAPRVANALGGSTGRLLGSGAGFGAISGAGELNDDRATGALYGAGTGAGGAAVGRAVAPLLENITSTKPIQTLARYGNEAANAVRGTLGQSPVPFRQAPRLSRTDNAVSTVPIGDIRQNVSNAQSLGLPYTLADATPQTRALAGSAARFSPNVRQQADKLLKERQAERPERAMEAVRKYMGDPVDITQRKKDLLNAGSVTASPDYEATFARAAPISDEIDAILRTRTGREALGQAYRIAENEGYDPRKIGFDLDAQGEVVLVEKPSFRALDLVKRSIDGMVEGNRNPVTGALDLQGNPTAKSLDTLRKRLIGAMDRVEPRYKDARAAYEGYAKQAEALERGYNAPARQVLPRDMQRGMQGLGDDSLAQYRSGYATRVIDDIAKTERGNPLELFMGTPGSTTSQRRAKVGMLFPDAQGPLDRMGRLEGDMTSTYQEVLGGSPTQPRRVADEQFASRGGDVATSAMIDMATGSPGVATGMTAMRGALRNFADARNLGGIGAQRKADEIGPTLLGQDSVSVMRYLDELERRQREVALRRAQFNRTGGLIGGMGGAAAGGVAY